MLERKNFMPVSYLKKEIFTGSYRGMRFREEKSEKEEVTKLLVTYWPQPYCFDATPDDQKISKEFDFSEEGICKSIEWLNEVHQTFFTGQPFCAPARNGHKKT